MLSNKTKKFFENELASIKESGLYKSERIICSPQAARIKVKEGAVLNFCANNYLGLADSEELINAAQSGLKEYGHGLSSVRFICGTQNIHKQLEEALSRFHTKEDCILYAACFDANGGLFEPLLGENDAIISDALNHASIIDGIRLCKAKRYRYEHSDMNSLRECLQNARNSGCQNVMIATDGVFSMDGEIADLATICTLASEFDAMVMVDECHASGFLGESGRGSAEHCGVLDKVDVITSTLGKALGGAIGGFTVSNTTLIELLRQRSRPYLFSNSLPPAVVFSALRVLELLDASSDLRERLIRNTNIFRSGMKSLGFHLKGETHPIVPVMLGDAKLATQMADALLQEGIYVVGFSFPVVPKGQARIRTQMSAAHSESDIEKAISAFEKVGRKFAVI